MGGICKQENQITHFAQFSVVQILKQIENIPQKRTHGEKIQLEMGNYCY